MMRGSLLFPDIARSHYQIMISLISQQEEALPLVQYVKCFNR